MAYGIIKRLNQRSNNKVLIELQEGISEKQLEKGQRHQVFKESFDAKPIYHRSFLSKKINYIHLNAVRGNWKLADHWEDFEYSSARFMLKTGWKDLFQ